MWLASRMAKFYENINWEFFLILILALVGVTHYKIKINISFSQWHFPFKLGLCSKQTKAPSWRQTVSHTRNPPMCSCVVKDMYNLTPDDLISETLTLQTDI